MYKIGSVSHKQKFMVYVKDDDTSIMNREMVTAGTKEERATSKNLKDKDI